MGNHLINLAVVFGLLAVGVCAQEYTSVPYITVAGYAEVFVEPDVAVWTVQIQKSGRDLGELQKQSDADLSRLIETVTAMGIPRDAVTGGRISVGKEYEIAKRGRGDFTGYSLTRVVQIEQQNVLQYEDLLRQLMGEQDFVATPRFTYAAEDSVRAEVQLGAVENARTKAVAMAAVLESEIGPPLIISEYPIITDYQRVDQLSFERGQILSAAPQLIKIQSTVYVRFAVKPCTHGS